MTTKRDTKAAEDKAQAMRTGETVLTAGGKANDDAKSDAKSAQADPAVVGKPTHGDRLDRIEAALRMGDPIAAAAAMAD